jgi:putative membrane-bound dehydrogenase-like protein
MAMKSTFGIGCLLLVGLLGVAAPSFGAGQKPRPIRLLFLGDQGHHKPADRCGQLKQAFGPRGIHLYYTEDQKQINSKNLALYDGLMVYANINRVEAEAESAILTYVANGGAYIPVHCASYCFHNSPKLIELLGGQFKRHGVGTFRTQIQKPDHPIMKGFKGFESWDETYVHHKHNEKDRIVLSVHEEKGQSEPWTWVRRHGQGRVFYTAWGHDQRTWSNPGFHDLLQRGIAWAVGEKVHTRWEALKLPELVYEDQKTTVPNYEKRNPAPRFQKPLSPADSMKLMQLPPGFEISLFASEPMIGNPTAMTWDHRGRLWIAESLDYPHDRVDGKGRDRIKILEDTNGDGKADKVTVFAEGLSIPTSLLHVDGGLLVAQAPHFLLLKDTNGDDKADEKEIVFSGWGTGDTHAGPSNLRFGVDNQIYGTVGYSGFNGKVDDKSLGFGNGIFRISPDLKKMEFLANTSNNTWGLGPSETGQIFASTANNTHSAHLTISRSYYEGIKGLTPFRARKIDGHYAMAPIGKYRQVDVHGGYTAAAGHDLYTARTFPKEFWNRIAFVNEPTGHLVHMAVLEPDGSSYQEVDGRNLLASADEWTAPIVTRVGPQGDVWVVDWYSFIIQHNPLPKGFKMGKGNAYVTPLRDKNRARIYRIRHKDATPASPPSLDIAKPESLVAALGHNNMLWRVHAQRLLRQRGKADVVSALMKMLRHQELDAIGSSPGALHALWTLHALGQAKLGSDVGNKCLETALKHAAPSVRRAGVLMLPATKLGLGALVQSGTLEDKDPQVRLEALLAIGQMPTHPEVGKTLVDLMKRLEGERDIALPHAFSIAASRHSAAFLDALFAANPAPANDGGAGGAKASKKNLIPNASFEEADGLKPKGWSIRNWSGEATQAVVAKGRSGKNAIRLSAEKMSESGYHIDIKVKPYMNYRLTGWVKTENVVGSGRGAMFYVSGVVRNASPSVRGTHDWRRIVHEFDTQDSTSIRINCMLGGWGKSTGTIWYDDLVLTRLKPSVGNLLDMTSARVVAVNHVSTAKPEELKRLLEALPGVKWSVARHVVQGLAEAWPKNQTVALDAATMAAWQKRIDTLPAAEQVSVLRLAWQAKILGLKGKAGTPQKTNSKAELIELSVLKGKMLFDKTAIQLKVGKSYRLVFKNIDDLPHNISIIKPGTLEKVGKAADAMLRQRDAEAKHYIPNSADILASSDLVYPGLSGEIVFNAPKKPGDYPFVCTFPGHWRLMKGVFTVAK